MKRALLLAVAAVAACSGESTRPPVPTSISVSATAVTLTQLGATQSVTATVLDDRGQPMQGESITWSSSSPSVTVAGSGNTAVLQAVSRGTATVTANSGSLTPASIAVTVQQIPAAIVKIEGDGQEAPIGSSVAVAPAIRVTDAGGAPVEGLDVIFTALTGGSVAAGAQTTDADGVARVGSWTLGLVAGPMLLTATIVSPGSNLAPVNFAATATPADIAATAAIHVGDWQAVIEGTAVGTLPTISLHDEIGRPVPGRTVTFEVTAGDGSITQAVTETNANGRASVGSWTVGPTAMINTLKATVSGELVTNAVLTFRAVGCTGSGSTAGFTINVCFLTPVTTNQRNTFVNAAARWGSIITGNLAAQPVALANPGCTGGSATGSPSMTMTVDDLVIFARIEDIDGLGSVLGSAGPCLVREAAPHFPFLGQMRFDVADLPNLEAQGRFADVILHEMGHVLGIGIDATFQGNPVFWGPHLRDRSTAGTGIQCATGAVQRETHFAGEAAREAFATWMPSYTAGPTVPVANVSCPGSINSHWRESVLGSELMTPNLNSGANPLSIVTVMSLQDLGYQVDPSGADMQALTAVEAEAAAKGPQISLHNDVYIDQIRAVDSTGRFIPDR